MSGQINNGLLELAKAIHSLVEDYRKSVDRFVAAFLITTALLIGMIGFIIFESYNYQDYPTPDVTQINGDKNSLKE